MEVNNPTPKGGYNSKLFHNQQAIQKYNCAICSNVLKDALQIPESNDPERACRDCYERNIRYAYTFLLLKKKHHSKV